LKYIGCRIADISPGSNYLVSLELHAPGGSPYASDAPDYFHVISGKYWCQELDIFIGNQQPFIAIADNCKLGRNISKKSKHMCPIDQLASVMRIASTQAYADLSSNFSCIRHDNYPFYESLSNERSLDKRHSITK